MTIVLRQPDISMLKELYRTRGDGIRQIMFDTECIILHEGKSDDKAITTVPWHVRERHEKYGERFLQIYGNNGDIFEDERARFMNDTIKRFTSGEVDTVSFETSLDFYDKNLKGKHAKEFEQVQLFLVLMREYASAGHNPNIGGNRCDGDKADIWFTSINTIQMGIQFKSGLRQKDCYNAIAIDMRGFNEGDEQIAPWYLIW